MCDFIVLTPLRKNPSRFCWCFDNLLDNDAPVECFISAARAAECPRALGQDSQVQGCNQWKAQSSDPLLRLCPFSYFMDVKPSVCCVHVLEVVVFFFPITVFLFVFVPLDANTKCVISPYLVFRHTNPISSL